jgi:hypothetical protein
MIASGGRDKRAIFAYFIHVRLKRDGTRAKALSSLIRAQIVNDLYVLKATIEGLLDESDWVGLKENPVWLKVHPLRCLFHRRAKIDTKSP